MKILIIDDHELLQEGIESRIKQIFPLAHYSFASCGHTAQYHLRKEKIDIVICDLEYRNTPDQTGFKVIRKLRDIQPDIKVIALTSYNSYRVMKMAIIHKFNSFLDKGCSFEDFENTIKQVLASHDIYYSTSMKTLLKQKNEIFKDVFNESIKGVYNLSKREREILIALKITTETTLLAEKFFLSPDTIDTHIRNIRKKLVVDNRKDLAFFAKEFENFLDIS